MQSWCNCLMISLHIYQRDMQSAILQHKEKKKQKEMSSKSIGEEMRKEAMEIKFIS